MGTITMYETPDTAVLQQARKGSSIVVRVALVVVALLIVAASGAFVFYTTAFHPAELHAQATAVVQGITSEQTQEAATHSPQHLYTQLTGSAPAQSFPLDSPVAGWSTTTSGKSSCAFSSGAYHIHGAVGQRFLTCMNTALSDLGDFVLQVQMKIISGDGAGLLIRSPDVNQAAGYMFDITSNDLYNIASIIDIASGSSTQLAFGKSTGIQHPGFNQSNLLTVIAQGKHLFFYINGQFIKAIDDDTFHTGYIGFNMYNIEQKNDADVAFNQAQIWRL